MRASTDRLRRGLQDDGRFLDRQLNEVVQDECSADRLVDALERFPQQAGDLGPFRRASVELGPASLVRQGTACEVECGQALLQRARWATALALPLRERGPHGDAIQPGRELGPCRKRPEIPKRREESLLEHLFDLANGRAHVRRNGMDRAAVPRHERGERCPAPFPRALGQRLVALEGIVELLVCRDHCRESKAGSGPTPRRRGRRTVILQKPCCRRSMAARPTGTGCANAGLARAKRLGAARADRFTTVWTTRLSDGPTARATRRRGGAGGFDKHSSAEVLDLDDSSRGADSDCLLSERLTAASSRFDTSRWLGEAATAIPGRIAPRHGT
jgi:hypothetical protein